MAVQKLIKDTRRLEDLAEHAVVSRMAAEAAAEGVQALAAQSGSGRPRFRPALGTVYLAETAGYVSLSIWSCSSGTELRLLVGRKNPPTNSICRVRPNHVYAGGVVRPGGYWKVESQGAGYADFDCRFTPLF